MPFSVVRSETFFERVTFSITSLPGGLDRNVREDEPARLDGEREPGQRRHPARHAHRVVHIGVRGTNQGRTVETDRDRQRRRERPDRQPARDLVRHGRHARAARKARIHVTWPAATDANSPIAGYEVQRSVNGGAWGSTVATPGTTLTATYSLAFDTTYRFRVRAVDTAGTLESVGGGQDQSGPPVRRPQCRASRGAAPGVRPRASAAFKTTETGSAKPTSTIGLTFTGHSVAVVGPKNPRRGKAQVFIDGVYVKTISMKSSASLSRQVVFGWVFPDGGTHTISLVPTGTGHYRLFRLDAIVVGR